MYVFSRDKILYKDVDKNFCVDWLKNNLSDFKCLTPESEKNLNEFIYSGVTTIQKTKFEKSLLDCVRSLYRTSRNNTIQYWTIRGYNEEEAKEKVSNIQRTLSKRCVEYWIKRGHSENEATKLVSEYQRELSKKANEKRKIDYWLNCGYTYEIAFEKLKDHLNKTICFRKEFWVNKGYTEEQANEKIKEIASAGSTLNYWIDKLGIEDGTIKHNEIVKKKARCGKDNPQFGKPAPKMSGRGISGYYKDYYFRSLMEYMVIKQFEKDNIDFICNDVLTHKHDTKKVIVKYIFEGKTRTYTPDFIVGDKIIEVKNKYAANTEQSKLKFAALEKFIADEKNGYNLFELITEVVYNINEMKDDYESGILVIDKNKEKRFLKQIQ